jgi:hypothetical protein
MSTAVYARSMRDLYEETQERKRSVHRPPASLQERFPGGGLIQIDINNVEPGHAP